MSVLQQFLSLYLFLFTLLTVYFGVYAIVRGGASANRTFTAFCAFSGLYLLGYLMEINSIRLQEMIFWNGVQYLGLPFVPSLWLLMALQFEKPGRRISRGLFALLTFFPVLAFLMRMTNSLHHLFYTDMRVHEALGMHMLFLEKGPAYSLCHLLCPGRHLVLYPGGPGHLR